MLGFQTFKNVAGAVGGALSRWNPAQAAQPAPPSTAVRAIEPHELVSLLGPPRQANPYHDQILSDLWVQPYRGPLDLDRYGMESHEMRQRYRTQYREVPVLRAAVRGKADDISCLEPTVLPVDKDNPLENLAAEFLQWTVSMSSRGWRGVIETIYTPGTIDGFSLSEPKLEPVKWKGRWMWGLAHLRSLDTVFLRLQLDQYRNVISVVNLIRGLEYYDAKDVVLYSHNPMYSNPFGQSDLRAATRAANIIEDVYKVWYVALKVFGMPYMVGKTASPITRSQMAEALKAVRSGGYAVVDKDDDITVLDLAAAAAATGFENMIHTQREDIFFAIRGVAQPFMEGDGGADAHTDTGVQQGTSDAGEKGASLDIADTINRQLVPFILRPNFGEIQFPRIRFGGTDWEQTKTVIEVVTTAQEAGAQVSAEWFHEAANIPPPRDATDVLRPAGQPGAPGAPGAGPPGTEPPSDPGNHLPPPSPPPPPAPAPGGAKLSAEAEDEDGDDPLGPVKWLPTAGIVADPDRFQWRRGGDEDGAVRPIPDQKFDIRKCKPLAVWKDPEDGLVNCVDGHHRLQWAERDNIKRLPVRFISAKTAKEAKKIGYKLNVSRDVNTFAADTRTFSALPTAFGADDAEHYSRYYAADDCGCYAGNLHRHFGLNPKEFAVKSGLVRKQVRHADGKTVWHWVRPAEAPTAEQPKNADPGPHPPASGDDMPLADDIDEKSRTLLSWLKEVPAATVESVTTFVKGKYDKLAERYGPAGAKAVIGAMIALTPVPVPGTSLLPIAVAEAVKRLRNAVGFSESPETQDLDVQAEARALLLELYQEMGEQPPAELHGDSDQGLHGEMPISGDGESMDEEQFADFEAFAAFAGGLVPKKITVKPKNGKPYQRTVMVRPDEAPADKADNPQDTPQKPTSVPTGGAPAPTKLPKGVPVEHALHFGNTLDIQFRQLEDRAHTKIPDEVKRDVKIRLAGLLEPPPRSFEDLCAHADGALAAAGFVPSQAAHPMWYQNSLFKPTPADKLPPTVAHYAKRGDATPADAAPELEKTKTSKAAINAAREKLGPELATLVARGGKGEGGEIKLSKDQVESLLVNGIIGFVSAGRNPNNEADSALDDSAVSARHDQLRSSLVESGYKFAPVRGHYGGVEDSFMVMVPEADKDDMVRLGKSFNQDSVIVSVAGENHMVFTTGPNAGKEHAGQGFKPGGDDYYSEYCPPGSHDPKDCVKFTLRFDFGRLHPKGFDAVEFKEDAHGHEHKGKGPGGGRFVKKGEGGDSGGDDDKAKKPKADGGKKPAGRRVPEKKRTEKGERAKKAHVMVDKDIQRYAETHGEPQLAKALKGKSLDDNEPVDVVLGDPKRPEGGIELKTIVVMGKNDKITMHGYPIVRKMEWEKKHKAPFHTVIFDDRKVKDANGPGEHDDTQRVIYYRRGTGSFRLAGMHKCKNMAVLKKLMAMDEKDLPEGAQRTDGRWREGTWKTHEDAGGKGYKNTKTGEIVRQRR